jgi:hypothetical protein
VYRSDITTLRGSVNSFLEAEDMAVDFLPRDALPGHLQGDSLSFGALPLTHDFTFEHNALRAAS